MSREQIMLIYDPDQALNVIILRQVQSMLIMSLSGKDLKKMMS